MAEAYAVRSNPDGSRTEYRRRANYLAARAGSIGAGVRRRPRILG